MKYYTCLVLSNSEERLNALNEILKQNDFVTVKTRFVLEFMHAIGFYKPECILIDLDSFQGDELVNTLLKSDKKYLKDALVISNTKIDGYKCVKYENLNTVLNLKKTDITEKQLINFNEKQVTIASSLIRQKLIELGFIPKYNGFYMLAEIILLCSMSNECANLHKLILPAVAHKFDTSISNITQCVRKSIQLRDESKYHYPYAKPTMKQIVKYIIELLNDEFLKIMHNE